MQIRLEKKFENSFFSIYEYIAQDKKSAANSFKSKLFKIIKNLINNPYKYRKSRYFDDENIRDMVFEGYTIVYKITKNSIIILNIFNKNQPPQNENN